MTLSHGTIEPMRVHIGLKCGENDARYLFPDQNGAKALTMMKGLIGTAVMNLDYTEQSNIGKTDALPVCIYRGTLIKVVSPFVITVDNKRKHNLLICGSNEKMANTILQNYIVSALLHVNASVYCVDGDTLVGDDGLADFYNAVSAASPRFKATRNRGDIIHLINEVYQKYLAWKKRNCDEVVIEAVTPGTLVVGIDIAKEKQWARFVDCRGPDALLAGHLMERLGWTFPRKNAMMKKTDTDWEAGWTGMEQMITANIALDIFAIILSLVPVLYILNNRRYRERLNRYFLGVSVSNVFMIVGDLADWLIRDASTCVLRVTLSAFSALFYAASAFALYFFARYVEEYLHLSGKTRKWYLASVYFVCGVQIFFAAISPFTGAIFTVTEQGYQRGSLFLISQLVPLYCYLLFTAAVLTHRRQLNRRELIFFLLYIFIPLGGGAAQMFLRGIAVVNTGVALALLCILVNVQFEYELRLREKENELARMRVDIMLSQIQPHFLYNALATISHLCKRDPIEAQKAVQEFSAFLRTNMDSLKNRSPIPFEQELNHAMNYLRLEQRRFQSRLKVVCEIRASDFFIPPLSLQPLVENAVRHGILKKEEGGIVTVRTLETEDAFLVLVEDDGVGFEKSKQFPSLGEHTHMGIENVRGRLASMMGGTLDIQSSGRGTVVTMSIPKQGGERHEVPGGG